MRNNDINTINNTTTMKTIYISGKIAGLPFEKAKDNFNRGECRVIDMFLEPEGKICIINPLELLNPPQMKWSDFILRDLLYLTKCDAIYMLSDWQDSPGARVEHEFAKGLGIEIIYQDETKRQDNEIKQTARKNRRLTTSRTYREGGKLQKN